VSGALSNLASDALWEVGKRWGIGALVIITGLCFVGLAAMKWREWRGRKR